MNQKTLIALVGPTAIGKTSLSIKLAKYFQTDIVSADSRQFFKEMHIGTATPTEDELQTARHHFIKHKSIFESYTVGDFERDAIAKLEGLFKKKDLVIMVGGSGLYVDAVIQGLDDFPEVDGKIREALMRQLQDSGIQSLQEDLERLDPEYHKKVDLENPHRLVRALEVCLSSNRPYSSFLGKEAAERGFRTVYLGMRAPRETVYERINSRVDAMIEKGLVEEARALYAHRGLNALQTVGYKELFSYFDGDSTLEFAVSEIKKNTRRFAKRQLTWYRKNDSILWVDYDATFDTIISELEKRLNSSENAQ